MVWQSPSPHASSDASNGNSPVGMGIGGGAQQGNGGGGSGGSSTMGTEYTLQGVMRFLQTEWHRHERDRNNWEIERAEMKARIAKLEGENRAEKRLHQVYLARIKILERALKKERADRAAAADGGAKPDETAAKAEEAQNKAKVEMSINEKLANHTKAFEGSGALYRAESARNKSRVYLEKCLQEITYLLAPPSHPSPQQQAAAAAGSMNVDSMLQQQQQQQQQQHQAIEHAMFQQQPSAQLPQPSPSPNHQPPPPPPQHQPESILAHRSQSMRGHTASPFQAETRLTTITQPPLGVPSISSADTSADKLPQQLTNSFGSVKSDYGKQAKDTNPFSAAAMEASISNPATDVGVDAWDFDEKLGGSDTESEVSSASLSDDLSSYGSSSNHSKASSSAGSRRKVSLSKRRPAVADTGAFKVKFALRGHLDVVRAVVFTGGGTFSEPEICTAGDDGVLKRWHIPGSYHHSLGGSTDVDVQSHFTHRGHSGIVTSLAAAPYITDGSSGATEAGWVFSGGQDATVKVWEPGRVEAKVTLIGHTDAVWALTLLPSQTTSLASSPSSPASSATERILLASGSADGTVKIWSVTPPPARGYGFTINYSLLTTITRPDVPGASPTCIAPLSLTGETFLVSYTNAQVIIFDTATGDELVGMASQETYDGTPATGVSSVVSTTISLDAATEDGREEEEFAAGATGKGGTGGVVITGHEDQYVRFFDANSGQCTYTMLAHPSAIASLALSPDGRELVSAGHDASLRFWDMSKRSCAQEITSHRLMRGEGVCTVIWSADGRWVVSGGGDGVVKVYAR